jgi:hypothetical protein
MMLDSFKPSSMLKEEWTKALNGDIALQEKFNAMGEWELMHLGISAVKEPNQFSWCQEIASHGMEIELTSKEVNRVTLAREFNLIPDHIRSNELLLPYLSPTALEYLGKATTETLAIAPMAAGACEFLLSQVARIDVHPNEKIGGTPGCRFKDMIVEDATGPCIPGRNLVRWLKRQFDAKSTASLLSRAQVDDQDRDPITYNTIQGWQSGKTCPTRSKAFKLWVGLAQRNGLESDALQDEWTQFEIQLWATSRMEATLRLVRNFAACLSTPESGRILKLLESSDLDDWCRRRYAFWLAHWKGRKVTAQAVT